MTRALLRAALSWGLHPLLVALALGATQLSWPHLPPAASTALPVFGALPLVWLAERWLPHREAWRPERSQLAQDLLHNLFSTLGTTAVARAAAFAALVPVAIWLEAHLGLALWPASLPMPAQLALALVIKELPYYATHRWLHSTALGWRLHLLHHGSPRLYSLSAGRTHPVNVFLTYGLPQVPLILLGASPELFAWVGTFMGVHGTLQHANIELRYGWLNAVFATAEVHRHHHSREAAQSQHNLGHNVMLWDHLFATWRAPVTFGLEVGVNDDPTPSTFAGQLGAPFRRAAAKPAQSASTAIAKPAPSSEATTV